MDSIGPPNIASTHLALLERSLQEVHKLQHKTMLIQYRSNDDTCQRDNNYGPNGRHVVEIAVPIG